MTCVHTFHAGLLACLALPCLALPCLTDQARAALSACGGDPFLARISICSCTPDFCQRNFHLARIRRFDLLHSAAERRQSENSVALPIVRLVHCALPPGLIAALRLRCTLCRRDLLQALRLIIARSTHTNQQHICSAGTPTWSS